MMTLKRGSILAMELPFFTVPYIALIKLCFA